MKTKRVWGFPKIIVILLAFISVLAATQITSLAVDSGEDVIPQMVNGEFISGILSEEYSLEYPAPSRARIMSVLDPVYDPRTDNLITSVKNQGPNGLCWAFAGYGAIEAYMLQHGFGEQDLSELHMAYATSTSGGNTSQGFSERTIPSSGGNRFVMGAYLMRGTNLSGTVDEGDDPFGSYISTIVPARSLSITQSKPKDFKVENILFLGGDNKTDIDRDTLKQAVRNYGSVGADMYWEGNPVAGGSSSTLYWKGSTNSYYYDGSTSESNNHGVLIIGWDDSFDKSNFSRQPPNNGAWLVKNSWGSSWGDDGYFWISYEDKRFPFNTYVIDGVSPYNPDKTVYEYDYKWSGDNAGLASSTGYFSRVYTVATGKSGEMLTEIIVGMHNANATVSVDVIPNFSSFSSSYSFSSKGSIYTTYPGYYTIQLDDPVALGSAGSKFAVVVKIQISSGNVYIGFDSTQATPTNSAYRSSSPTSMASATYNYVIKAITVPAAGSVTLGSQASSVYEGGGTTTFLVSTTNIPNGVYAVELNDVPTGVTADNITIAGNKGTLTVNIPATVLGGSYSFNAVINGVASNIATLIVSEKPVITIETQPPATTSVTEGSISGSLSIIASVSSGTTLTYQWYSNVISGNTGGTAITGATNASFSIPTGLTSDTYYYYCIISAANADSVTSDVVTVIVTENHFITITSQPESSSSVITGYISGVLSVTATESCDESLTYQWYSNVISGNTGGTAITGATNASFAIPTGLTDGIYYYYCVVSAVNAESVASEVATVIVSDPYITINTQPSATTTVTESSISGSLSISATVSTGETPTYQWYSNTESASTGGTAITGATSASFVIPTDLSQGDYYYYCVVSATDADSVVSEVAMVTVNPEITISTPEFTTHPTDQFGIEGDSVSFTVAADGDPSYQWQVSIDGGDTWEDISGKTNNTLVIANIALADSGNKYRCVATNSEGNTNSNVATLTVTAEDVYSISAVPDTIIFSDALVGYDNESMDQTVTITNTGNAKITGLDIFLLNDNIHLDGSNFEITSDLISVIDPEGSLALTVRPKNGLTAGSYNEYLIITDYNDISEFISLEFLVTAEPTTGLSIDKQYISFLGELEGYSNSSLTQSITIMNTGTEQITGITATLSGSYFEISEDFYATYLDSGEDMTIYIRPVNSLTARSIPYTGKLIIEWDNDNEDKFEIDLSFVVSAVPTYTLTINTGIGGSIITGAGGQYKQGTAINISAEADEGYTFAGWTSSNGGSFGNADNLNTTFTMPENATTITANFTYTGSVIYGDLNNTGSVDVSDLILMMKLFAQPGSMVNMSAADVNGDGKVNNADLILFMKYFAQPGIVLGPGGKSK